MQGSGRPRATLDSPAQVAAGNAFKSSYIHPHIAAQITSLWPEDAFTNFALAHDPTDFPQTHEELTARMREAGLWKERPVEGPALKVEADAEAKVEVKEEKEKEEVKEEKEEVKEEEVKKEGE